MAEIITIGNQENSKITAFGDDCKYNVTNAFSYVIFKNTDLDVAREKVINIKSKYQIPENIPIHIRLINNSKYRNKNDLEHLNSADIINIIIDLIEQMNTIPFLVKGSYYSGQLPIDKSADEEFKVFWSDKGIQSLLAKSALVPLNLINYNYNDLNIVISKDSTKINFLGKKRRQADRWSTGFPSIEAPEGYTYKFEPIIKNHEDEVLLQLADVIVYSIAHAFDIKKTSLKYRIILEKVRNIDIKPFKFISS